MNRPSAAEDHAFARRQKWGPSPASTLGAAYGGELELQVTCRGGTLQFTGAPATKIIAVPGQDKGANTLKVTLRFTVAYRA